MAFPEFKFDIFSRARRRASPLSRGIEIERNSVSDLIGSRTLRSLIIK